MNDKMYLVEGIVQ